MLTTYDIEFMRQSRAEMVAGRQSDVTIVFEDGAGTVDPITGERSGGKSTKQAQAVVTEISSQTKADQIIQGGIEVEKGDIWFSVAIEDVSDIYETIKQVIYDGRTYEVLSKDKKGIGERNRVEFVGRSVT